MATACNHAVGAFFGLPDDCTGFIIRASDDGDTKQYIDHDFIFCPDCGERLKPE